MKHLDIILQKRDLTQLYSSLTVKLNAYLMAKIPPPVAKFLHTRDLRPYSMFTLAQRQNIVFRLSLLADSALSLLEAAKNTRLFDVSGLEGGVAALDAVEYDSVSAEELSLNPPRRFKILFASPVTYRCGANYTNIFRLAPILYSVADKLRLYERIDISNEEIEALCETVNFPEYHLRSAVYLIKRGGVVTGFTGEMTATLSGTAAENSQIMMLLRYATYAGLGAKTALGMGGVLLDERL
jgi:CRISPR-associated endoribonuclease Cas6